jgi:hypothetical protein
VAKPPDGRRHHALLPPPLDAPGPPFLPVEGEVYRVRPLIYGSTDPASLRPVVVLLVPALKSGRIQIVTRTSQVVRGVKHLADPVLGLDRDGVFSDLAGVERSLWCSQNVILCGRLGEATWRAVQERFS